MKIRIQSYKKQIKQVVGPNFLCQIWSWYVTNKNGTYSSTLHMQVEDWDMKLFLSKLTQYQSDEITLISFYLTKILEIS